jgi:ankyrin repeat protein
MLSIRIPLLRVFFVVSILCLSGRVFSQLPDSIREEYDTSGYISVVYYEGALDYNLMIAASKGYSMEIGRLIKKGADIDAETDEGGTPLVFAISNNHSEIVKLLIKYGADLNKINTADETPLLIAVKNQNEEIAEALIRGGADIDFADRYNATSLHYASIYGYLQLVDLLLYYEASVDKKTVEGITPLAASIWAGNQDVADLLIQNGANMEARDNEGFTPFLIAALDGDTLLMDLLYKKGVDIYATNRSNHNALTLSILADRKEATEYLLKIGNKWTNSGKDSVSPYSVASKYHRKEIIKILENHNITGKLKYGIDQVSIMASSRFCINDIYTGISLSFKEPYLNGGFIAGCDVKLWYTRVLVKESEHLFYQYMDKGSVVYAGLFKDFALTDNAFRGNFELSTSLLAGYTFGNKLKGTLMTPNNKFMVIPDITFKWTKKFLSLFTGMEYMNTDYYHVGPLWLRIGASYNLFFDNVRTQIKTIKWY